jgi:hypothetical protein
MRDHEAEGQEARVNLQFNPHSRGVELKVNSPRTLLVISADVLLITVYPVPACSDVVEADDESSYLRTNEHFWGSKERKTRPVLVPSPMLMSTLTRRFKAGEIESL